MHASPVAWRPQVGLTEEQAVEQLAGELDVYISKFKPMKNTLRCGTCTLWLLELESFSLELFGRAECKYNSPSDAWDVFCHASLQGLGLFATLAAAACACAGVPLPRRPLCAPPLPHLSRAAAATSALS